MSVKEEIEEMFRRDGEGDPLVLDEKFGLGDTKMDIKMVTELSMRLAVSERKAIIRLAEEIDKLSAN